MSVVLAAGIDVMLFLLLIGELLEMRQESKRRKKRQGGE